MDDTLASRPGQPKAARGPKQADRVAPSAQPSRTSPAKPREARYKRHQQEEQADNQSTVSATADSVSVGVGVTPKGPQGAPFMFAGILASLVGSVFFSLSILCIKLLPDAEDIHEKAKVLLFRGFFLMFFTGCSILATKSTFKVGRDELWVNVLRAVFGTVGVFGLYCALKYISMGDATALVFSSPIWTSILSHFILKEPLQWLQLLALPISMLGIIFIAHPSLIVTVEHHSHLLHNQQQQQQHHMLALQLADHVDTNNASSLQAASGLTTTTLHQDVATPFQMADWEARWPGIAIALATSLMVSFTYIVLKFRKKTPIQTTTFWLGAFMALSAALLMSQIGFGDFPDTCYEWGLLFGNGICSWIGQSCLQWAFLYEQAGVLSIVRTLDVAATFALSAIFLDEEILWTSILGATIIASVVASIMINNWLKNLACFGGTAAVADVEEPAKLGPPLEGSGAKLQAALAHQKLAIRPAKGALADDDTVLTTATTTTTNNNNNNNNNRDFEGFVVVRDDNNDNNCGARKS